MNPITPERLDRRIKWHRNHKTHTDYHEIVASRLAILLPTSQEAVEKIEDQEKWKYIEQIVGELNT